MYYKRLILTGYSGFLGSRILRHILTFCENSGISIDLYGRKRVDKFCVRWFYTDFEEPQKIPRILDVTEPTLLIHLASQLPGPEIKKYDIVQNAEKIFLHKCLAAGVSDVCYASSGGVYGFTEAAREKDFTNPLDSYSRYKLETERIICRLWPRNSLIIRYFFPFGEEQRLPRLIPNLINRVIKNELITIKGINGLRINPVYIDDAVEATLFLISNRINGIFNIAGRRYTSIREIARFIAGKLNKELIVQTLDEKEQCLIGSIDKLLDKNMNLILTDFYEALGTLICHLKDK